MDKEILLVFTTYSKIRKQLITLLITGLAIRIIILSVLTCKNADFQTQPRSLSFSTSIHCFKRNSVHNGAGWIKSPPVTVNGVSVFKMINFHNLSRKKQNSQEHTETGCLDLGFNHFRKSIRCTIQKNLLNSHTTDRLYHRLYKQTAWYWGCFSLLTRFNYVF